MKPTFGKIGYTIGLIIYMLLLNIFFREKWFADAEARGLSDQQEQHASVGNTPSVVAYDPKLIERIAEMARMDYTEGFRITMLIVTLVPVVVAALAFFLIPRRPQQRPQTTR